MLFCNRTGIRSHPEAYFLFSKDFTRSVIQAIPSGSSMPAKYSVVLNSRCKTVKKLAERVKDERSLLLTRQLVDLAELSRQPLEAEKMTEFIRRSMEIVALAADL